MSFIAFAKAGASAVPGAGRLPFLPGGGGEIPARELRSEPAAADLDALAAYARVCGFTLRGTVPATWPHIEAFGLHMALITDGGFPFGPLGLVHIGNSITQHRPIGTGETVGVSARTTPLEPHPKGRAFSLISEAHVGEELVWEERSTMLRRGGGGEARDGGEDPGRNRPSGSGTQSREPADGKSATENAETRRAGAPPVAWWKLPGDLGARYAAVSGDSNPIHMHALSAKAFGFPRAIAHGMWTKARCLAALEPALGDSFTVEVSFGKPILLPSRVGFAVSQPATDTANAAAASAGAGTDPIEFAVLPSKGGSAHLEGTIR